MAAHNDKIKFDGVIVKDSYGKGKGLFASKSFKEGDVIFEEAPLVSCQFSWNRLYNYTACDNCMKSLETAQNMARRLTSNYDLELPYHDTCCENIRNREMYVQCPDCKIQFCCEDCFIEAKDSYHQILCLGLDRNNSHHPINILEEKWKTLHYPPETTSIMLILRIIAQISQSFDPISMKQKFENFFQDVKIEEKQYAHKLLGDQFKERIETLHKFLLDAVPENSIGMISSVENLQNILGLIGMNGQGIGTSSLSQYVHNVDSLTLPDDERETVDDYIDKVYDDIDQVSGRFLNCEGSGLYSLQSRCNHSCTPNAEVTFPFNNNRLVLVALSDIDFDEEICICYLSECQRIRSRHSRRKILRENYLFDCTCVNCEEEIDQPSETSSDDSDDENEIESICD